MSGAEYLEFGGKTSCYVLKSGNHAVVLDAGTGLYSAKELLSDCTQIDVVLSHLHYDHIVGLLKPVFPKESTVKIYGEFENWGGEELFRSFFKTPFWPVAQDNLSYINVQGKIELVEGVFLSCFEGNHPDYASISRLDLGNVSFCFATDYEHGNEFPKDAVEGCSVLAYDGTFSPDEYIKYKGWGHSDWFHGHMLSCQYGISKVLIVHHDPMKTDEQLLEMEAQAQAVNPNIIFAREGYEIEMKEGM